MVYGVWCMVYGVCRMAYKPIYLLDILQYLHIKEYDKIANATSSATDSVEIEGYCLRRGALIVYVVVPCESILALTMMRQTHMSD
jgi:hypothetical protein